jgi:hypothetical protein
MKPIAMKQLSAAMTGFAKKPGPGLTLVLKTIELGYSVATYPGLCARQLALVKSVLTHLNGDSRRPHYEQTFSILPAGTSDAGALALVNKENNQPGKSSNVVFFVMRGTGDNMATQVGGYGACAPYQQAA